MKHFAAIVSLAALAAVAAAPTSTVAEEAAAKEYVLAVEGMSCPTGCVPKVREALESVDGVESVQVDFESAQAVIKMQPGKDLTVEACDKSFGNQGYFVSAIEERTPTTADAGS